MGDDVHLQEHSRRQNGYLDTITDAAGHVVQFSYDDAGRVTTQTFQPGTPDERVITYGYDPGTEVGGQSP